MSDQVIVYQHREAVVEETMQAGVRRARIKHECRLDWYLDKSSINDRQHQAGMLFRADYLLASAAAHTTGGYGDRISSGSEFTEAQVGARRRLRKAMEALGWGEALALVRVAGHDEWASGDLPRLREGLSKLADHYGLEKAA